MKLVLLVALLILESTAVYAQITIKGPLKVPVDQTVLFGADTSGNIGYKLIWYGRKGAFRAGGLYPSLFPNNAWDSNNVGQYSFASGQNTIANGFNSTAMGFEAVASGLSSMALGWKAVASGDYSTAMGTRVSTNNQVGSFVIGDASPIYFGGNDLLSDNSQQFSARFIGGYKLFTTVNTSSTSALGVALTPGGNAWTTISDSTRKENFRRADGLAFLAKISQMRLGSWNYKGQDMRKDRHCGPMAQDFFAAFGHDEVGTIGENKTINQADFDGVNLIAIQALIRKIEKLEAENQLLHQASLKQQELLRNETTSLHSELDQIKRQLSSLSNTPSSNVK